MVEIANGSMISVSTMEPNIPDPTDGQTVAARNTALLSAYRTGITYTEVDNVVSIPEFGGTGSTITFNSVSHGITQKTGNEVRANATFDVADNFTDAGQKILREAFISKAVITLKVAFISGTDLYCQGTVSKSTPRGEFDGVVQRQYIFNVQGDTVEGESE